LSKLQSVFHNQHYKDPEASPENFQQDGSYVCSGGLDILKFHKNHTDL